MALSSLRSKLAKYSAREQNEKWRCSLPPKSKDVSYFLSFEASPVAHESAPERFWKTHLEVPDKTIVVSGSHLFFYNADKKLVIRLPFFATKPNWDSEDILKQLKERCSVIDLDGFTPWQNTYLAAGDVEAYEALAEFFHRKARVLLTRRTTLSITIEDVRQRSPILLGRPQTNPYIETIVENAKLTSKLGYRISDQQGVVEVSGLSNREKADLKKFPHSRESLVGPITNENMVFGIVTRFPNPGGRGAVTIISCDYYSRVASRIVQALVDDAWAAEIFNSIGWKERQVIPRAFQLLFTITRFEGDRPDESKPKLVTWRSLVSRDLT